jgi:hypothetical protein
LPPLSNDANQLKCNVNADCLRIPTCTLHAQPA